MSDHQSGFYRAAQPQGGEHGLVARLLAALGGSFPPSLIIAYYVALKASPVVVLSGPAGGGKAALASGLAAALLGPDSPQAITIGSNTWAWRTSQSSYYQGLHERFGASTLAETLQEAAAPENSGRAFLILLKGQTIDELEHYTGRVIPIGPDGVRRLAVPGLPPASRPVLPPNCFITATLHMPPGDALHRHEGLRDAIQISFDAALRAAPAAPPGPAAPVGLQRTLLAAVDRDAQAAADRLAGLLGAGWLRRAAPQGLPQRDPLLRFLAASFAADGRGLFDPSDPRRSTTIARAAALGRPLPAAA